MKAVPKMRALARIVAAAVRWHRRKTPPPPRFVQVVRTAAGLRVVWRPRIVPGPGQWRTRSRVVMDFGAMTPAHLLGVASFLGHRIDYFEDGPVPVGLDPECPDWWMPDTAGLHRHLRAVLAHLRTRPDLDLSQEDRREALVRLCRSRWPHRYQNLPRPTHA